MKAPRRQRAESPVAPSWPRWWADWYLSHIAELAGVSHGSKRDDGEIILESRSGLKIVVRHNKWDAKQFIDWRIVGSFRMGCMTGAIVCAWLRCRVERKESSRHDRKHTQKHPPQHTPHYDATTV